jgi:molecular chaperone DnaK (HSP70)
MDTQVLETIGFDLGHGETAVAKAKVESIEPPQMLEVNNKKIQITAIGIHPELGILVGDQALIQAGVTQLQIGFKQKPNNSPKYRQTIHNFVETYDRILKESKQIEGGEVSQYYVGCPSGWSTEERQEYQTLIKEAGIKKLSVIPESRAAFMQAKEGGKLGYNELLSTVLIVDIGSSTTDFTLVKSLHEMPLDFGRNALGASLIDKAIFARTLANHEHKELLKKIFEQHSYHKFRSEIQCRRVKEDYFSNEQLYSEPATFARGFEFITPQIHFIPQVNKLIMEEIINQPLPELENKSWMQSFREAVNEAKEKLKDQGIVPQVVLMTGGASRMKFTRDVCAEIFPEPATQERPDPEPERCIALGLARVGRWELRAAAFKEEVNKLCDSPKLKEIVSKHIPELIDLLLPPLAEGLLQNAVKSGLKEWKDNKIRTLADLQSTIEQRALQWLKSDRAQQIINTQCVSWFNTQIRPDLATETDPICQKFQISKSSLRFEGGIDSAVVNPQLSFAEDVLGVTVAFLVSLIIAGGTIGSLIALLLTGHFVLPIALVYGAAFLGEGVRLNKEKITEALKTKIDIPGWIRFMALSDRAIDEMCEKMNPDLQKSLKKSMTQQREAFDELIGKVGQQLKNALDAKAEEAIILIQ